MRSVPEPSAEADVRTEVSSGMEQARIISRLLESEERLTAALVASQDRLAALLALIEVRFDSLDDNRALGTMLEEALELTESDGAVLCRGESTIVVGSSSSAAQLRTCMAAQTDLTRGPRPVDIAGAAAVVATLGDTDSPATLGLVRHSGRRYSTGDLQLIDAILSATDKLLTLTRLHLRRDHPGQSGRWRFLHLRDPEWRPVVRRWRCRRQGSTRCDRDDQGGQRGTGRLSHP